MSDPQPPVSDSFLAWLKRSHPVKPFDPRLSYEENLMRAGEQRLIELIHHNEDKRPAGVL